MRALLLCRGSPILSPLVNPQMDEHSTNLPHPKSMYLEKLLAALFLIGQQWKAPLEDMLKYISVCGPSVEFLKASVCMFGIRVVW